MKDVGIEIDLSLNVEKAKEKLEQFKKQSKKQEVKVKLDLSSAKGELGAIHLLMNKAFTIDSKALADVRKMENALKEVKKVLQQNEKIGRGTSNNSSGGKIDANVSKYLAAGKQLQKLYSDLHKSQTNGTDGISESLKKEIDLWKLKQAAIRSTMKSSGKLSGATERLIEREERLQRARTKTTNTRTDTSASNSADAELRRTEQATKRLESQFKTMENRIGRFSDSFRGIAGGDAIVDRLEASLRRINTSNVDQATDDLRNLGNELQRAQREAAQLDRGSGSGGHGFLGKFGRDFKHNMMSFTAGELLADGIRNAGYALRTVVMDYDKAMTNLKKVSSSDQVASVGGFDAIGQKASTIARNVGKSSSEVIQAMADTLQTSGKGMKESIKIAEQSMKLANVADMTQEAASKGVVTMTSAFKLDALKQMPVVVNGVTKSTDQLTDAMDKVNWVGL